MAAVGLFGMKVRRNTGTGLLGHELRRAADSSRLLCIPGRVHLGTPGIGGAAAAQEFGTEEQKRKYLPRLPARGEISSGPVRPLPPRGGRVSGSDPARMTTIATPSADGKYVRC